VFRQWASPEPRDDFTPTLDAFPEIRIPEFVRGPVFEQFLDGDAVLFDAHEAAAPAENI